VESIQRPDAHRYAGAFAHEGDDWYERSAVRQGTNLNKRDLTRDLTERRGLDIARRLAARADVVLAWRISRPGWSNSSGWTTTRWSR
jgi:crotonobetainyl-CoA:carnitine CoA-transferase CaiB-like acyl-CoA transferase